MMCVCVYLYVCVHICVCLHIRIYIREIQRWTDVGVWCVYMGLVGKYFTRGDEDDWEEIVVTCPLNRIDVRNS